MILYQKWLQRYNRKKLKLLNSLNKSKTFNFDLRYGKDDSRGLSCGSTLNIRQDVLKSGNLLHKQGIVDSQFGTTIA